MRSLILGTAGHIDHGKTTLVRALTGVDTDRLVEEKRRGITIDLGFAHLRLAPDLEVGIVDVPGHEAFIRNMLAGATGIDLALIVIAADEGIMPQTREHLAILELLGVRGAVVAITMSDLVDAEWLELVLADIADSLRGTPFATARLIPVSATTGEGLDTLREALRTAATSGTTRRELDLFRLPVDRVFSVHGTGTVITGTIWSGSIAREQNVRLLPSGLTGRVRAIQAHGLDMARVGAGQRAALGVVGIDRDRIRRGDILVTDPAWEPTTLLTVRLRLLENAPAPLRSRTRIRFHLGTTAVLARVALLEAGELEPGATAWAQLRLEAPVVARAGDRFVIRSYSPVTTIGGGEIAEPLPGRRKRRTAEELGWLEALITGSPVEALAALADAAEWRGVPVARLSIDTRFAPEEIDEALEEPEGKDLVRVGGALFAPMMATTARALILEAVDSYHARHTLRRGIERAELRRTLPAHALPALGDWTIGQLEDEGAIAAEGPHVRRAGFRHTLDPEQKRISELLRQLLEDAGLTPPPLAALPPEIRALSDHRQLLRILEEEGVIVPLTTELYVSRASRDHAIAETRRLLAGRGPLAAADFREAIPVSRKYLIPILEHFDEIGITRRSGDQRIVE
jgi:selenocysteine-specific elongation factor